MTPRYHDLDLDWAKDVKEFCERARTEMGSDGPESQIDFVLLAGYDMDLAFLEYGLGEDLATVRTHFAEAVQALTRVFELRATSLALPIVSVGAQPDPDRPLLDHSLTNSKRGLLAMYLALISGGPQEARRLAALIGDPPEATYLGEDSTVCTPEDQQLAYFLKALLLGEKPEPPRQTESSSEGRAFERFMLEALWAGDGRVFLDSLRRLLVWQEGQRRAEEHRQDPAWWICVPGLALSVLAASRFLIEPDSLPQNESGLPLALTAREDV